MVPAAALAALWEWCRRPAVVDLFGFGMGAIFVADAFCNRKAASALQTLQLLLRLLALVSAGTFVSLAGQVEGLSHLEPALKAPQVMDEWLNSLANPRPEIVYSLRIMRQAIAIVVSDGAAGMKTACMAGAVISVAAARNPSPVYFAACYALYLCMKKTLGAFLNLQFDALLLEMLFVAVPLSVLNDKTAFAGTWLLRLILFRLMFGSGVVKLASGDRVWRNLRATKFHFQTQPLPTALAPYAYFMPDALLRAMAAATLIVELPLPVVAFFGQLARQATCFVYLCLQANIAATGHYGHFNALSAVLSLALLDDNMLRHWRGALSGLTSGFAWPAQLASAAAALRARYENPSTMQGAFMGAAIAVGLLGGDRGTITAAAIALASWFLGSLDLSTFLPPSMLPFGVEAAAVASTATNAMALACIAAVAVGQWCSLRRLMARAGGTELRGALLLRWHALLGLWCVGVHYGLFANMTLRRLEVVLERSDDGGGTWEQYRFRSKPGQPSDPQEPVGRELWPLHLPRLDWRLWFVPLRSFATPGWFLTLAVHLLEGTPAVLSLLARTSATALNREPPDMLRATLWEYKFTNPWHRGRSGSSVWERTYVKELLPPITLAEARSRVATGGRFAGLSADAQSRALIREAMINLVRQRRAAAAAAMEALLTGDAAVVPLQADPAAGLTQPVVLLPVAAAAPEGDGESESSSEELVVEEDEN